MNKKFADISNLKRGTTAREKFGFPFQEDIKITMRVLSQSEIQEIQELAKERVKERNKKNLVPDGNIVDQEIQKLLIQKAVYTEDGTELFFETIDEAGSLTMDELQILIECYNQVQEKFAPVNQLETPEDFDIMIEEIKKKGVYGMSLSSYTMKKLVSFLIPDQDKLLNDNGSTSTPLKQSEETLKDSQSNNLKNEIATEYLPKNS